MLRRGARAGGPDPRAALERAINAGVNRLLALDPGAAVRLERLEGRTLMVRLRERSWRMLARVHEGALRLEREHDAAADVTVSGRVSDFVALLRARQRGDPVAAGRIEISGDLAIAQEVQALLGELELDWDEWLARYVGDAAAHRFGRLVRGALAAGRASASRLERDVGDYLRHEAELVPQRAELEALERAIFELADAVDRAEVRLRRLREEAGRP